MKEYCRITDDKEPTFDSLEQLCNSLAADGWEVLTIHAGYLHRTATLVREVPDVNAEPATATVKPARKSRAA